MHPVFQSLTLSQTSAEGSSQALSHHGDALTPTCEGGCESGVHAGNIFFFLFGPRCGAGSAEVPPSTTDIQRKAAKSDRTDKGIQTGA